MNIIGTFFIGFFGGGVIEYFLTFLLELLERKPLKINYRFTLGKKISLISLPIWGMLAVLFTKEGMPYFTLFVASAFVGLYLNC